MALFDPARHETLIDEAWGAHAAEAAIRSIVDDTLRASRGGLWPAHPLDEDLQSEGVALYTGAAGVVWGLSYLASQGAIERDPRYVDWALRLPELYGAKPDTGSVVPSYLLGESGVLLTALRARVEPAWLDRLEAIVSSNVDNPTLEALWGAPGTMLAALLRTSSLPSRVGPICIASTSRRCCARGKVTPATIAICGRKISTASAYAI